MSAATPGAIPPGSVIGIMGGGQLGRMTALAAARLGYRCHIFTPERDSPAAQVAAVTTVAAYEDEAALDAFANAVDVVTFEFENVPGASVRRLTERAIVRPSWTCLATSQDRLAEKDFINGLGIATAPYRPVDGLPALQAAVTALGRPAILKTVRFGYDGKGQCRIGADTNLLTAWTAMGGQAAVLEGFVDFEREVSSIVARGPDGHLAAFDVVENRHVDGILDTTVAPAPIPATLAAQAVRIASAIAEGLDLIGLLAVEMFVGRDGHLLVNEIAPRPHNSGHWTMDACITDQFEQFVRSVCGLPLGSPARHSDARMQNLIGNAAHTWPQLLTDPTARVHLYGKAEARPGRKMGHVTWISPRQP